MSETAKALSLSALCEAVRKGAALRCRTKLQADGGDGGKVFPPTYAGGIYAVEDRRFKEGVVRCVLLDSVQSQANRMEEALLEAFLPHWRELPTDGEEDPNCDLPVVAVQVPNRGWITSLTAPHRIHDAILRDSEIVQQNGAAQVNVRFRDSEIGQAIVRSRLWDATAFYRYCPTALLFGTWDSTAGEGLDSAKIPRAVVSEIIGVDITPGVRTHSRIDPLGIERTAATIYRRKDGDWAAKIKEEGGVERLIGAKSEDELETGKGGPKKYGKEGRPSDINHGNVTPDVDRFGDSREVRKQHLDLLPDLLRDQPVALHYKLESSDGRVSTNLNVDRSSIRGHAVRPGGVTMAYALHTWTLSLTQLRRLRFPPPKTASNQIAGEHATQQKTRGDGVDTPKQNKGEEAGQQKARDEAARTVLAALALYAFALLRDRDYLLRSRCELVPKLPKQGKEEGCKEDEWGVLEQINRDGSRTCFIVPDVSTAYELFKQACQEATEVFKENSTEAKGQQEVEPQRLPSNSR